MFALRGAVPGALKPGRSVPMTEEFREMTELGHRLVSRAIYTSPELTKKWQQFMDTVLAQTRWGEIMPAKTFDDNTALRYRPKHSAIEVAVMKLINKPEFADIREAFESKGLPAYLPATVPLQREAASIDVFVANFQRPLVLWDQGGFSSMRVLRQLMSRKEFEDDIPELQEAMNYADDMMLNSDQGFSNIANNIIRQVLDRHGYDHIVYTNTVEFPGTPSFIAIKPGTIKPITDFGANKEGLKLFAQAPIALTVASVLEAGKQEDKEEKEDTENDTPKSD
jgi:hypothetical protein